ncbi:4438_t:CDS:2 [Entrophospora sp. SA101]|nr:4438_t:CDS:2 [Entrophospora sp. SA101]
MVESDEKEKQQQELRAFESYFPLYSKNHGILKEIKEDLAKIKEIIDSEKQYEESSSALRKHIYNESEYKRLINELKNINTQALKKLNSSKCHYCQAKNLTNPYFHLKNTEYEKTFCNQACLNAYLAPCDEWNTYYNNPAQQTGIICFNKTSISHQTQSTNQINYSEWACSHYDAANNQKLKAECRNENILRINEGAYLLPVEPVMINQAGKKICIVCYQYTKEYMDDYQERSAQHLASMMPPNYALPTNLQVKYQQLKNKVFNNTDQAGPVVTEIEHLPSSGLQKTNSQNQRSNNSYLPLYIIGVLSDEVVEEIRAEKDKWHSLDYNDLTDLNQKNKELIEKRRFKNELPLALNQKITTEDQGQSPSQELVKAGLSLQTYLDGKYPTPQDKEQVKAIEIGRETAITQQNNTTNKLSSEETKQLEGKDLDLSSYSNLEKVTVNGTYLKTKLTTLNLSNCAKLINLACSGNQLTNLNLTNCINLKILSCSDNNLPDLTIFKDLVGLEELGIHSNPFIGSLKPLENLSKLKELNIDDTDIDRGLEYLPDSLENFSCSAEEEERKEAKVKAIYSCFADEQGEVEKE